MDRANATRCVIFAGPTLSPLLRAGKRIPSEVLVLPPAQRGDVTALLAHRSPGSIALVDGFFHQVPAVGHQELRRLMEAGWRVWGLSSIGAIRAYELCEFGMRGYGMVYDWFRSHPDFADDEVALLHMSDPPFVAASEPLIHIRFALADLVQCELIAGDVEAEIVQNFARMWYGYRTLAALQGMLTRNVGASVDMVRIAARLRHFDNYRVKSLDLARFLEEKLWTNQ